MIKDALMLVVSVRQTQINVRHQVKDCQVIVRKTQNFASPGTTDRRELLTLR